MIKHCRSSVYFPSSNGAIERFHYTLKRRLQRVRDDPNIPLKLALDKVMFDIRNSPTASHGETPFCRLFKRQIRSEFSPLSLSESRITGSVRDYEKVYSEVNRRRKSSLVIFREGEKVLLRRGRYQKFTIPGTVIKKKGRGAWLVKTPYGFRTYNQFHMAHNFDNRVDMELNEDLEKRQDHAYDSVRTPENNLPSISESGVDSKKHHYNLRLRNKLKRPDYYIGQ